MEVTVEATALATALQRLKGVAREELARTSIPCLAGALLSTRGSTLTVSAFDLEVAVVSEMPVSVRKQGAVVLNLQAFDFTCSLKGAVTITRNGAVASGRCTVEAKGTSARFHEPGSPEDFPKLPEATLPTAPLNGAALLAMLRRVSHAISTDGSRGAMTGMYLHTLESGQHRAISTDGKRMATLIRKLGEFNLSKSNPALKEQHNGIVLPIAAVVKLQQLLESMGTEGWEFGCSASLAVLLRPGFSFLTKLVDAPFPDYLRAIGQEHACISVSRQGLLQGLERVSLVSKNVAMVLEESGVLRFEARSETKGEGSDAMEVKKQRFTPRRVWFPYKHITEALQGAVGEEVLISVPPKDNKAGAPAFIQTPGEDGYVACIMPLTGMD